jgi:hypothetical protein
MLVNEPIGKSSIAQAMVLQGETLQRVAGLLVERSGQEMSWTGPWE